MLPVLKITVYRMFDEEREKREKLERKLSDIEHNLKKNRSLGNGIDDKSVL